MKIVKFKGGLGNQMFQYAFLKLLQEKMPAEIIKGDLFWYGDNNDNVQKSRILGMQVDIDFANKEEIKKICYLNHNEKVRTKKYRIKVLIEALINHNYFFERDRSYREIDSLLNYIYYDGYWQSWRYLESIREKLILDFRPRQVLSELSQNAIEQYKKKNSVFVGVRRGDYLKDSRARKHYGVSDPMYYKKAVEYIRNRVEEPTFIFFSDDIVWVKKYITPQYLGIQKEYIEYREDNDIYNDFEELFVMSSCKHAIISNSTFNFWGAWLIGHNNKIIVAPKEWFKDEKPIDIVPENWIRL